jgi:two-component system sensor histidine kinase HydH
LPILIEIEDEFSDEPLGTLVTLFDWRQIETVLSGAVAGRSAAALFDRQNNLLSNTDRWFKTEAAKKLSASAITSGYQGFTGFSWRVTVSQNRSQALTPVRQMAYIFAGMLIATVLLLTLVAVPVASSITRPLARLTEFANRFMRSSAELDPPTGGPAEVDTMARAFGKMIEDLERSKENLTRAAKLAVVGEMAAAMSHEVRTPLGILRSSAQLLLREPGLSEEGREVCGFIISETDRLNKLVTTLIDSARPRAPEFSATDIGELAQQCTGMLRAQAEKKRITLACHTEEGAIAACDAEQITQVILNLLLNAIQVLPEGGRIEVAVRPDSEHILLTVADDGPGIPPEHREQVFDPFFTQRAGGIGLGLSIVRQIVAAHHGEISVGSSAMHGAEFRLRLPVVGI